MKRILFFLLLVMVASSACKKSQKEVVFSDSLTGTWKEDVPLYSRTLPSTIIFRADSTYTWSSINMTISEGTYHTGLTSNPNVLNVTFIGTESPFSGKTTLEKVSLKQIRITSANTLVRNFVR